jgi:O-antigen/teichoic acid export membrane protein
MDSRTPPDQDLRITGESLARNTLLVLFGRLAPLAVGVVSVPAIVRGLGPERFGLLTLAWVVLGYFRVFDLGIGRSTTKFVAEAAGQGRREEIPRLVWTSVTIQTLVGLLGAGLLFAGSPFLVTRVLHVSPELWAEARDVFRLVALSIPFVLAAGSLRGTLEAMQKFGLANAVGIPASTLTFLLPWLGVALGMGLRGIVLLLVAGRAAAATAFLAVNLRADPKLARYVASARLVPRLLGYGGWITVSSIVGPLLLYLERILLGSLRDMSEVGYYSGPSEIVTRLGVVPQCLGVILFPTFSTLYARGEERRLGSVYARSLRYLLVGLGPLVLGLVLFSSEILGWWLGAAFARESTEAFRLLALGFLVNALALVPFALLQAAGRPDLPAKFHLLELPVHLAATWWLVGSWGIAGAGAAWLLRVVLDAALLFSAASRIHGLTLRRLATGPTLRAAGALGLLAGAAWGVLRLPGGTAWTLRYGLLLGLFALFLFFVWGGVLDAADRGVVGRLLGRRSGSA